MRKPIALAVASLLTLSACTDSSPSSSAGDLAARIDKIRQRTTSGEIVFASYLRPVGDCAALLDHVKAEAAARVGPYGLPGLGGGVIAMESAAGDTARSSAGTDAAPPMSSSAAPTAGGDKGSGSSEGYSTTNNQEVGVDEPDIVKTDGRRIITITGAKLTVVPVDGATAGAARSVRIGDDSFQPAELLVVGDKALVFGTAWGAPDSGSGASSNRTSTDMIFPATNGRATVTEVDISGSGAPAIGRTLEVDGSYLTGRLVGTTVRLVVRSEPRQLEFVTPQNQAGEERARKANEEVVLESTLDDWLPSYRLRDAAGASIGEGRLTECERVDAPTEFAGFGSVSVLTFDATKPLGDGDAITVLAGGDTVYASEENLYVATQTWVEPDEQTRTPRWANDFSTSIHQFGIGGSDPATYLASGTVPGHLLNQFSLSEHEGVLRAATTKGVPWGASASSVSVLTTMRRDGDRLEQVGQVGDMGKGERIYSVRYAGDVAYLVTFRQTDPFYTLDLADPANPTVVGELKITGYSGYLHPIADDLVIGVGQEASAQGRVQGTKVSLFDVSDLANPAELAKWTVPASSSGAEFDHKAFLWWPATKTLVLPLQQYELNPFPMPVPTTTVPGTAPGGAPASIAPVTQPFFGAVVLKVDRATGITEQGRIAHAVTKPANLGATDCRAVPASELTKSSTSRGAAVPEVGVTYPNGMLVLVCSEGATGGAVGYQCNRVPTAELGATAPGVSIDVPRNGWTEWCWPSWDQPNPILRSLVVGPALWTLSPQRLQSNDLGSLGLVAQVAL